METRARRRTRCTHPGPVRPAATRQRLATRADTVELTVALPRALHLRAAVAGATLRWTINAMMRQALTEWLDRQGAGGRRP
jgi:hypothetical protein